MPFVEGPFPSLFDADKATGMSASEVQNEEKLSVVIV